MIGDINLFLEPDLTERMEPDLPSAPYPPHYVTGEVAIMIASPSHRGRGYGRAALELFMAYIKTNIDDIFEEYAKDLTDPPTQGNPANPPSQSNTQGSVHQPGEPNGVAPSPVELSYFRARIKHDNIASIRLFESFGFRRVGEVNYFREVELRRNLEWMGDREMDGFETAYV
ncbi:hypothetical protein CAC42_5942 [Sphaceloma murrayae]|uniref:N-acetyltransferase domain-containing protein n=1 Tax=Sphaceloma murrayae TaxID=2082308 RepID=A0A2K1QZN4_9PEZI|nr:hypothetical protein CAC42_5942 [Sphaceloma murrayae]